MKQKDTNDNSNYIAKYKNGNYYGENINFFFFQIVTKLVCGWVDCSIKCYSLQLFY